MVLAPATSQRVIGKWVGLGVVVILAVVLPPLLPPYALDILVLSLIYGILAVGLDMLMGYTGLDSLGQAAFFGSGSYALGILTANDGVNWFVSAGVAMAVCAVLAAGFGLLAVRLRGLYFLLITLALGQVLWGGVQRWGTLTGGYNGLSGVTRPLDSLINSVNFAYFVMLVFAVVVVVIRFVVVSPFGLGLQGCRDNELRLRTLGYRPFNLKWIAFILAGITAGIAGVLNASYNSFVAPSDLSLQLAFSVMLMVIVGGAGTILGAILGAFVITALQQGLSIYLPNWWVIVLGAVYILTTLFFPKGILGALRVLESQIRSIYGRSSAAARGGGELHMPEPAAPMPEASVFPMARSRPDPGVSTTDRDEGLPTVVLSLVGVSKEFGGFTALEGVSLSFGAAERTAIIGPNGAGKTTLFNVISGLLSPTRGRIVVQGRDITGKSPHLRPALGLARTFQVTRLFPPLTVLNNMILGLLGWTSRESQYTMWRPTSRMRALRDRAYRELERVGLESYSEVVVKELSYGHQKQLDIALALATDPKVLLLDEPTAGLSQSEVERMMRLIQGLPTEITIIVIEHNLDVVFGLTDRLVVLDHGQVLIDGPQDVVRDSEDVRRIYFGAAG
ncbi:MAG: ABC transporter permease subunit [Candidatus Dormibacteraceae bacterium]